MRSTVRDGENHIQQFTENKTEVCLGFRKIFGKYLERLYGLYLLYEDIVMNECCKLREPKSNKPTNFERLVEGIAIQIALTWEKFARDVYCYTFIEYGLIKIFPHEISGYKKHYKITDINWKPQRPEEVEEILGWPRGYLSFKNTTSIKKKAEDYIDKKDTNRNPFLIFDKEQDLLKELDKFTILRNYLVHRSAKSERQFIKKFTVNRREPRSPGEYLSSEIEASESSKRYNQKYELGYYIMIFKECLYKMAEAKSICLPDWPQSYQECLEKTFPTIKEIMGENLSGE